MGRGRRYWTDTCQFQYRVRRAYIGFDGGIEEENELAIADFGMYVGLPCESLPYTDHWNF